MVRCSIICLLLVAASARADELAPPPPQAVELARLVLPQQKYNEMLLNVANVTAAKLQAQAKDGEHLPLHFTDKFEVELHQMLQYDDLVQVHARLLARMYNGHELRELIAFYQTPLGQKSVDVMPRIMAAWTEEVTRRMEAGLPGALQHIFPSQKASATAPDPKAGQ